MFFDLPLEQLVHYRPPRVEPDDFDAFWEATLAGARQHPLDARFEPVDAGLRLVETFDVTFNWWRSYGCWLLHSPQVLHSCVLRWR